MSDKDLALQAVDRLHGDATKRPDIDGVLFKRIENDVRIIKNVLLNETPSHVRRGGYAGYD